MDAELDSIDSNTAEGLGILYALHTIEELMSYLKKFGDEIEID